MSKTGNLPRLAFFISTLEGGGAERVMLNLAEGFAGRGFAVDFVVMRREGALAGDIPAALNVVDLGGRRLALTLPALIRYLRQARPQWLISALEDSNIIAILAARLARSGTKTLVTAHNQLSLEARSSTSLKRRLSPWLIAKAYKLADAIVAVSQGVAGDLAAMGVAPAKTAVIYNPILHPGLAKLSSQASDHPWLQAGAPPFILGVGRLTGQKNFANLLRALSLLPAPRRLILLGEGPERAALEALALELGLEERVNFAGYRRNPYPFMRKAALLALSSDFEGFGNVLVEAMAMGTNVVSTDCPSGPGEILGQGRFGLLVPMRDAKALASAIQASLQAPLPASLLKARAEDFSVSVALDAYQALMGTEAPALEDFAHA